VHLEARLHARALPANGVAEFGPGGMLR
jgi:hypothetical protein